MFQERFVEFVITRAFFIIDHELRGTVSRQQLVRVDLARIFRDAEAMKDVNDSQHIFNYQHFYVTFVKFWDLDGDSDGLVTKDDLLKFNESAVSPIVIERFFKSKDFPRMTTRKPVIDLRAFTYFLICSEDKTSQTAINFWFKLCDLDDDGVISIREMEELYAVQLERMRITGNETIAFHDILTQLMDTVKPATTGRITRKDLVRSKMADMFFNTLFDLQRFLMREYQSPSVNARLEETTKNLSPWEIYVLIVYDQLMSDAT
jgi:serine/threonine-protein phosphatase 2A regulatory subunit B''